jgi:uncharacterized protein (TIGR04551 family)
MVPLRRCLLACVTAGPLLWTATAHAQPTDADPAEMGQPARRPGPMEPAPPRGPDDESLVPQEPGPAGEPPEVDPARDQQRLLDQGRDRPTNDGAIGRPSSEVFSEDWWSHTRPIVELHGFFRTRGELFHNFFLGRGNAPGQDSANLWAPPQDHSYQDTTGQRRSVLLCGQPNAQGAFGECQDKTQSHANLRLRLNPEIHISDNLRILSQVDLLDNLVLGSNPEAYAIRPGGTGVTGYRSAGHNAYAPLGAFSTTQGPPTAGVNGYRNSIDVQRAWAEYLTPVGQIGFGRMPYHWGLGMLYNSGDCLDCDFQTNVDRIMFTSAIKSMDLHFGGTWDFVSTGPTNQSPYDVYGGQPYNTANLSNVNQWSAFVAKRANSELQRRKLSRGDVVLNAGLWTTYRSQLIDVTAGETPLTVDRNATNNGFERRGFEALTPDAWLQVLWNKLRLEAELATVWGSMENSPASTRVNDPLKLRMWGLATQAEFKAVEDKLRIQFGHGWTSGDPDVEGLAPGPNGLSPRRGESAMSTFRFHPAYYVDYIFFRRIMTRVQGAYYFRPSVEYDFLKNPNGQKFGGGAAIIWSRASEFVQAPGNSRDLGVELNLQLYYQSKDGSLNDDPDKMGGFFAALQYGVFFPMAGLEYLPLEHGALASRDLSTAQTVRLILGVMF